MADDTKHTPYVFISYSHTDSKYAHRLAQALEQHGVSVWIDDRIDYGTQWPHVIQEQLDGCSALIVIMTPNSYKSEWVQSELSRAKRKAKSIFPLLLEGDEPWLSVESLQYVDVQGSKLPPERFYTGLRKTEHTEPHYKKLGDIEFVFVPKGKFIMGSKDDNKLASPDEKPQHTVEIPYDYWIGRFPVTNDQFAAFVGTAKYKYEMASDWKDRANHPVVNVSWYDAMEYCKWLNEKLQGEIGALAVRLPTEAEWEKAARGEQGYEWPWGNEFDAAKCNSSEGGKGTTTPVGAYSPQGDSPYGAADMAGNVWEWCRSLYKPYPYKADDGREKELGSELRVLRGGAWNFNQRYARAAYRDHYRPVNRSDLIGFRVVVAPNSRF